MVRLEGWPLLLSRFIRTRREMPFEWGKNDCLIYAADAVQTITGKDPAKQWRGYSTFEEAQTILKDNGGMEALITKAMGFPPHTVPLMARRGDVALLELEHRMMAGVVDDTAQWIVCPMSDKGTSERYPLASASRIWSY